MADYNVFLFKRLHAVTLVLYINEIDGAGGWRGCCRCFFGMVYNNVFKMFLGWMMVERDVGAVRDVLFQTALEVRVGDVNYGGHLANDAVLRLCHEVRMRWLAALGWSEKDADGAGLIMAEAGLRYLVQGFFGDVLSVSMGAEKIGRVGFDLVFVLTRVSDGAVLARVRTGMVCFDYDRGRVCRMPEGLRRVLEGDL